MSEWLHEIDDPARRLDLYLRALEYHIPKLGRSEVTGPDGGPVAVTTIMRVIVDPAKQ
jgi:hypothetical protein